MGKVNQKTVNKADCRNKGKKRRHRSFIPTSNKCLLNSYHRSRIVLDIGNIIKSKIDRLPAHTMLKIYGGGQVKFIKQQL